MESTSIINGNGLTKDLSVDQQIINKLIEHGVTQNVVIDDGAEQKILDALNESGIEKVFVDEEGALVIEYNEADKNFVGTSDDQDKENYATVDYTEKTDE